MPKYKKCPRCELNYILEDREYCDICEQELKGLDPSLDDEESLLCIKCHHNEREPGEEYCAECLKARQSEDFDEVEADSIMPGAKISSLDELSEREWDENIEESYDDNDGFGNSADMLDDVVDEDFDEHFDIHDFDDEEEEEESLDFSYDDEPSEQDESDEDFDDDEFDEDFDDEDFEDEDFDDDEEFEDED